jgi:Insertion element 4 transposase N-terminal/Transposase DDE domain
VSESAMSAVVGTSVETAGGLRAAVMAGPSSAGVSDDAVAASVLDLLAGRDVIVGAVAAAGHVDQRRRVLPGAVTVLAVLALCLFRRENTDLVLARVGAVVPGMLAPGDGPPTAQALSGARARLVGEPVRQVFYASASAGPVGGQSLLFGLVVTAFDGTVFDLAATAAIAARFATPAGGRFPQARAVTLVCCGTRRMRAAVVDSCAVSEQALVDRLAGAVEPGTLNLADRGFFSMARWVAFSAGGGHLAWRVKNGVRSLPARIVRTLPDGSVLVRLRESDAMLTARRRKHADRGLARLPDTLARLVEFTLTVTDDAGRSRMSRFRVLTTLLDAQRYPAEQLAAGYAERWQAEITYFHVKVTVRGAGTRLRGQSPHLARQEIWGLFVVYNALVDLAIAAAVDLGVDPDRISFVAVLALTRASGPAVRSCQWCGHPPAGTGDLRADLVAAIAAQPLNRARRPRTGPRTKRQRETERTRDVTYTITIVPPDLPKTE